MTKAIENRQDEINEIVSSLVKVYKPLQIYIFGSYAWGKPNKDSDIDFAIVIRESDMNMADRIRLAYDELWSVDIPTDILVYTLEEMNSKAEYHSTLQHRIIYEGTKIYEAA